MIDIKKMFLPRHSVTHKKECHNVTLNRLTVTLLTNYINERMSHGDVTRTLKSSQINVDCFWIWMSSCDTYETVWRQYFVLVKKPRFLEDSCTCKYIGNMGMLRNVTTYEHM